MTAAPALRFMSEDEFFDWAEQQEARYELVDGEPVLKYGELGPEMMAGATAGHDQIVVNLLQALRKLRGGPCRAKTADQYTRVSSRRLRSPDVTIDCGPWRPDSRVSIEPTVIFEALSPTTRRMDLVRKTTEYQAVESLKHFVLIEPDQPFVLLWSRREGGWEVDELKGLNAALELTAVGVSLLLADVYEDVLPDDAI